MRSILWRFGRLSRILGNVATVLLVAGNVSAVGWSPVLPLSDQPGWITNTYAEFTRDIVRAYNERASVADSPLLPATPETFDYALPLVFEDTRTYIQALITNFYGDTPWQFEESYFFQQFLYPYHEDIKAAFPLTRLDEARLVVTLQVGVVDRENIVRVNTNLYTLPHAARNIVTYQDSFTVHYALTSIDTADPSFPDYNVDRDPNEWQYWEPGQIWWFGGESLRISDGYQLDYDYFVDETNVVAWNSVPTNTYNTTLASLYYLPTNETKVICHGFSPIYWPDSGIDATVLTNYTWISSLNDKILVRGITNGLAYYATTTSAVADCYVVAWAGGWLLAKTLDDGVTASEVWSPVYSNAPIAAVTGLHREGFSTKVRDNRLGYPSVGPSGHYYTGGVIYPEEYNVDLNFVDGLSHFGPKKNSHYEGARDPYFNLDTMPQQALYGFPNTSVLITNTVGGSLQVPAHTFTVTGQVLRIDGFYICLGDAWWDRQYSNELDSIFELGESYAFNVTPASEGWASLPLIWFDVENSYADTNYWVSRSNMFGTVTSYVWGATNVWKLPQGDHYDTYWTASCSVVHGKLRPKLEAAQHLHRSEGPGALALTISIVNSNAFPIREHDSLWYTDYALGVNGWFTPDAVDTRYHILNACKVSLAEVDNWKTQYRGIDTGDDKPKLAVTGGESFVGEKQVKEVVDNLPGIVTNFDVTTPVDYVLGDGGGSIVLSDNPPEWWLTEYSAGVSIKEVAGTPEISVGIGMGTATNVSGSQYFSEALSVGNSVSLPLWSSGRKFEVDGWSDQPLAYCDWPSYFTGQYVGETVFPIDPWYAKYTYNNIRTRGYSYMYTNWPALSAPLLGHKPYQVSCDVVTTATTSGQIRVYLIWESEMAGLHYPIIFKHSPYMYNYSFEDDTIVAGTVSYPAYLHDTFFQDNYAAQLSITNYTPDLKTSDWSVFSDNNLIDSKIPREPPSKVIYKPGHWQLSYTGAKPAGALAANIELSGDTIQTMPEVPTHSAHWSFDNIQANSSRAIFATFDNTYPFHDAYIEMDSANTAVESEIIHRYRYTVKDVTAAIEWDFQYHD